MNIYIVESYVHYEGSNVDAVFDSEEKAIAHIKSRVNGDITHERNGNQWDNGYSGYCYEKWEVK